jgi:hypothetical protein
VGKRTLIGYAGGVGLALVVTLASGAGSVPTKPDTGSVLKQKLELLDKATDLTDRFVAVRAVGYVEGIADAAVGLGYMCRPEAVTQAHLREIVMKYLHANPDRLTDPAPLLVLNGLLEAYPCTRPDAQ